MPDINFNKAIELGFRNYIEKINHPSKFRQYITSNPALSVLAGAVLVTAGYLMRPEKKLKH